MFSRALVDITKKRGKTTVLIFVTYPRNSKTHKETTSDPDKYDGRYHETAHRKPARWQQGEM